MAKSEKWYAPKLTTRADNMRSRKMASRIAKGDSNASPNAKLPGSSAERLSRIAAPPKEGTRARKTYDQNMRTSMTQRRKDMGVAASPKATKRALAKGKRK